MKFHPFAEKFPLMEGKEYETFKDGIRATNGIKDDPILYRVVDGEKQGLDGRNRLIACRDLNIEPTFKQVAVPDDDVLAFILRKNVHRRHLTPKVRRSIVVELRKEGKSWRDIGDTTGISPRTAKRDLAAAGGANATPDTVTGKDGKTYSATRPKAPAERDGQAGVESVEEEMGRVSKDIESFCRKLVALVESDMPDDPWLQRDGRRNGAITKITDACGTLRTAKCTHVCPRCCGAKNDGKGKCAPCLGTGRMPKAVYDNAV